MTAKSIKASKNTLENGGNITKGMIDAGYSPITAHNPSNLTRTKAYQTLVIPKLMKAKVDLDTYINNIGIAMHANKQVVVEGDIITTDEPDIGMRLQGNKQAEKLLKIDQLVGVNDTGNELEPEDLEALAAASDEVELTRILFKKNQT